jgi:hypothetical protein
MKQEHDMPLGWHHGEWTTRMVVGKRFYWLEMKEDIKHFVHTCVKCQITKSIWKKKYRLYEPLLIPKWVMGKCIHGLYDSTPKVEWNGPHFSSSWSIF